LSWPVSWNPGIQLNNGPVRQGFYQMGESHRSAWSDALWDPVRGCSRKSAACINCYAETATAQSALSGGWGEGYATLKGEDAAWTGKVALLEERLALPFGLEVPSRVFVNSMSDLFHEEMADAAIDRVFAVMALAPQHQFQVLTKRQKKMQTYMADAAASGRVGQAMAALGREGRLPGWPLPNVWLGVTAENQKEAERRIPVLLQTPAAVRFIAAEPLLGALDLKPEWLEPGGAAGPGLDWVLAGGETGPKARPIEIDWVRSLRDQCARAGTPFYWNDWGAHMPADQSPQNHSPALERRYLDGALHEALPAPAS
jgi:protein gp37